MRITDAIVTRAHQAGTRVEFIGDPALLADVGGVGIVEIPALSCSMHREVENVHGSVLLPRHCTMGG